MTGAIHQPHPVLRDYLAGPMVGYDISLNADQVHLGVPSATATLIIALDDPLDVGWFGERESQKLWASVSGLHLVPALIRTHGLQRGIQLQLTPLGCRSLLGAPLAELAGHSVDLAELPRGLTESEYAQIAEQTGWPQRFTVLESLLLDRLEVFAMPADIRRAWRFLCRGHGVARTAVDVGWSRRYLNTRIRNEIGVSPKQLSRLARFSRARTMVGQGASLADAAYAAGFADQSHLSREWHTFAGQSPSTEVEFPFLQDLQYPGAAV